MPATVSDPESVKATESLQPNPIMVARTQVTKQDDATTLADTPHALTPASIQDMEQKGKLVKIDRSSITQTALENDPAFQQRDANGQYLPIYVMPDVGDQKRTAIVVDLGNGQKAVIANEGIHNWDANYVDHHISQSVADVTANQEYTPAEQYKPTTKDEQKRYKDLIHHIEASAKKNGIGPTHVLISDEPGVTDAYALKTKEGVNYIVIPKSELGIALSGQEQTQRLERVIDNQMPDIKKFDSSEAAALATHQGDQYIAQNTDKDNKINFTSTDANGVTTTTPQSVPNLSQASLDQLVKEKTLIPVKIGEIVGYNTSDFVDDDGKPLPADTKVYLASGVNGDFQKNGTILGAYTTDPQHTPYIIIDEKSHTPNAQYVQNNVLSTNADVDRFLANGTLTALDSNVAQKLQKPADIQILVNHDDTVTAAYSFETKEGKKYVVLPGEDVADATKQNADIQSLQNSVNTQVTSLQKGDNSPDGLVRANQADKWIAQNIPTNTDGRSVLPDPEKTPIDNATLNNLSQTGRLVELKRSDLTPGAAAEIAQAKDANGNTLPPDTPIYLVPGVNSDSIDKQAGQVMTTKEGQTFILVNERAHQWTSDNVQPAHDANINADISTPSHQKNLLKPEDVLADVLKGKNPEESAAIRRRYDDLMKTTGNFASSEGVGKEIMLIASSQAPQASYAYTGAASEESKEGSKYIFISQDEFIGAITDDKKLADEKMTMGHETTHNEHKDTVGNRALAGHDLSVLREHEMRADLGGAGPLASNNPLALAKTYEDMLRDIYNQKNPNHPKQQLSDQELAQVSQDLINDNFDRQHPSRWELIQALRHEDQLMKDYETNYKKEHGHAIGDEPPEVQKKIREAEAQQVEDQTIDYMQTRKQNWDDTPLVYNALPAQHDSSLLPTNTTASTSPDPTIANNPTGTATNPSAPPPQTSPDGSSENCANLPAKPHAGEFCKLRSVPVGPTTNNTPPKPVSPPIAASQGSKQPRAGTALSA